MIKVINSHIDILTEIIGNDLTYFSTKFIASGFVTQTATSDILTKLGIGDGEKARQLLNRVTTNYKIARKKQEWIAKFVAVLSSKAAYEDLAALLTRDTCTNQPGIFYSSTAILSLYFMVLFVVCYLDNIIIQLSAAS